MIIYFRYEVTTTVTVIRTSLNNNWNCRLVILNDDYKVVAVFHFDPFRWLEYFKLKGSSVQPYMLTGLPDIVSYI